MEEKRICLHCGKEFVTANKRQKYCSTKCRIKHVNESQRSIRAAGLKDEIRNCECCGKAFTPKTVKSRFCCNECLQKALRQQQKEERLKRKALMRCEECGKPLGDYHSNRYCSKECSYEANKRKLRESKPAKPKTKKQTKPKMSFAEVCKRAGAEGLSYGQYVLKYGV